jgi:hypothetical protein
VKNPCGEDEVVAVGLDGTLYTLEVSNPSAESKQEDYFEWLQRRGNSSLLPPPYTC